MSIDAANRVRGKQGQSYSAIIASIKTSNWNDFKKGRAVEELEEVSAKFKHLMFWPMVLGRSSYIIASEIEDNHFTGKGFWILLMANENGVQDEMSVRQVDYIMGSSGVNYIKWSEKANLPPTNYKNSGFNEEANNEIYNFYKKTKYLHEDYEVYIWSKTNYFKTDSELIEVEYYAYLFSSGKARNTIFGSCHVSKFYRKK